MRARCPYNRPAWQWAADKLRGTIGERVPKKDGDRFVTGSVTFSDDVIAPGMAHAAVLRSPHPHARIVDIKTATAAEAPGVLAVVTGATAREIAGPIPHWMSPVDGGGNHADVHCLALDKVLYEGQPVVAVVAATRADADAPLALIEIDYELLPFVIDADDALAAGAPRLYADWPDNVIERGRFEGWGCRWGIRRVASRLEDELHIQRYTSAPIETRVLHRRLGRTQREAHRPRGRSRTRTSRGAFSPGRSAFPRPAFGSSRPRSAAALE